MRALTRIAAATAAGLGLGAAGLMLATAGLAAFLSQPQRRFHAHRAPARRGIACDDIAFTPRGGGLRLSGWSMRSPAADRALVLVHGKDASRTAEFFGRFPELGQRLRERGYHVVMLDLRGHGQSEDAHHTFGPGERLDVLGAVDWLRDQGFPVGRIGLLGVSMGAAASIGALAIEPGLGAVVADCGYADLPALVGERWRSITRLPEAFALPGWWLAQRMAGCDLADARPVRWIRNVDGQRVFIIHGDNDRVVPLRDAYTLWSARPEADLWTVPGARHAGSYERDPAAYLDRVDAFFKARLI